MILVFSQCFIFPTMANKVKCKTCGLFGHKTPRSSKCLHHTPKYKKYTSSRQIWCLFIIPFTIVISLFFKTQQRENILKYEPDKLIEINQCPTLQINQTRDLIIADQPDLVFLNRVTDVWLSPNVSIIVTICFIVTLFLFKRYLAEISKMRNAILYLAEMVAEKESHTSCTR